MNQLPKEIYNEYRDHIIDILIIKENFPGLFRLEGVGTYFAEKVERLETLMHLYRQLLNAQIHSQR